MSRAKPSRRAEVLAELGVAGRAHSNAEIMFHSVLSEKMGLSAVEEKTLDLLERNGPLTAGELAQLTGLAPASVTGLVDRLARKGFVHRTRHDSDGRRVNVEINRDHVATFGELFKDLVARFEELYAGYSDAELELILDYVHKSADILTAATAGLGEVRPAGSGRS
jgi:DNA-binding MarR family transcriptional regulator